MSEPACAQCGYDRVCVFEKCLSTVSSLMHVSDVFKALCECVFFCVCVCVCVFCFFAHVCCLYML